MLPGSGGAPAATIFSAVFLVVACGGRSPEGSTLAPPQASSSGASLERLVRARLDSLQAQTTIYAKDLRTGREVAVRADVPMNTVSVIKLPIMLLAYRDAEAGRLNLDERCTLRAEDLRRGTGVLQTFDLGLNPTYRDLVTQMIVTSDNSATDMLIAKLGLERVNRLLDSLGYRDTRLRMPIGQLFRGVWEQVDQKYASLTDREVYERGFPSDSGAEARYCVCSRHGLNRSSTLGPSLANARLEAAGLPHRVEARPRGDAGRHALSPYVYPRCDTLLKPHNAQLQRVRQLACGLPDLLPLLRRQIQRDRASGVCHDVPPMVADACRRSMGPAVAGALRRR